MPVCSRRLSLRWRKGVKKGAVLKLNLKERVAKGNVRER